MTILSIVINMSDQKRWFKLWDSATSDDCLQKLAPKDRWAWAALGAYTTVHGKNGMVKVSTSNSVLAAKMGVTQDTMFDVLKRLPNVCIERSVKSDDEKSVTLNVTFKNWHKYQCDSSKARTAKWRGNVTKQRRGDKDKEKEENKKRREIPPISPLIGDLVIPEDLAEQRQEIEAWIAYKKEKGKKYRPIGLNALWDKMRKIGKDKLKQVIENSMANNWEGLFELKEGGNGTRYGSGSGGMGNQRGDEKIVGAAAPVAGKYDHRYPKTIGGKA